MMLWLHSQGYTYFSIPKLTYPEIKSLIDAKNRQVKKEKREMAKSARKAKSARGRRR